MGDRQDEAAIRAALSDLLPVLVPGSRFDVDADEVIIPVVDGRARVAVGSLISTTSGDMPARWPRLIEAWCASVLEQLRQPAPQVTAEQLRVRLVPVNTVTEDQLIVRPYGAYFQLELMADLPDRRLWIGPSRAAELGLTPDDAFAQGLRNTITQVLVPIVVREHVVGNGLVISMAASDDTPWVSAGLTSLANVFRAPSLPYGAIVAVPRLSAVMFTAVETDRVMADILLLGRLVADMYRDSNDRCSPELFWFHSGALFRIGLDDGIRVTLPVELEAVVGALPKF